MGVGRVGICKSDRPCCRLVPFLMPLLVFGEIAGGDRPARHDRRRGVDNDGGRCAGGGGELPIVIGGDGLCLDSEALVLLLHLIGRL